jgi:DNA mismatch repair protein MutL
VELKTKQDQEELGVHIIIEGSKHTQEPAVLPKGTSFSEELCFSTYQHDAIFLKSDTVEMRYIIDDFSVLPFSASKYFVYDVSQWQRVVQFASI